jgi:hypothetical protein
VDDNKWLISYNGKDYFDFEIIWLLIGL